TAPPRNIFLRTKSSITINSNGRPPTGGYEPNELPTAPPRNIFLRTKSSITIKSNGRPPTGGYEPNELPKLQRIYYFKNKIFNHNQLERTSANWRILAQRATQALYCTFNCIKFYI
ncbi:MAG TPA: hypothetical protein PK809_11355, partial [Bacteroidia bacterium]|nr:hypothetical protein [Bacteroidia bacterium]